MVVRPLGDAHGHPADPRCWQQHRNQAQPAAEPLTDRTGLDDGLPLGLVLIAVTVPLGLLIIAIGKPVLSYGRHRRHPTSVA